jgi:uncharacterized membrane protein YkvA (DUF1232 family)
MPRAGVVALWAALSGVLSAIAVTPPTDAHAAVAALPSIAPPQSLFAFLVQDDQPIERRIGGLTKGLVRAIRGYFKTIGWMFSRAFDWWGNWIKRAAFCIAIAIAAALADAGLVNAWRMEGLRIVATYMPMMLYIYARLLFASGVKLAPKLLLLSSLIYGMVWRDFVPDRRFVPGRVDDIILIIIATRAFVWACPEELLDQYAERAVRLRQRMTFFQRRRSR